MPNKNIIKKLKKADILKILFGRKLEDLDLINKIEKIFLKKRGYVIKVPSKGTPVILIVSGGMDSVIVWAYLMKVYKLKVYPVFLRRGQRRVKYEEAAVDFFYNFYKKKFPRYCNPVQKMNAFIPPMEIRFPITIASNNVVSDKGRWRGIPVYTNLLFSYATQYAYFLEITKKINIRTIFAGFMLTDGTAMKDETLTAMRMNNLEVATLTDDFNWQFIALPIEKNIGFFYDKEIFIKWATSEKIPLEKTRSCIMWNKFHCGNCISCWAREAAFKKAGIDDKTVYLKDVNNLLYYRIFNFIKKSIKHILFFIK